LGVIGGNHLWVIKAHSGEVFNDNTATAVVYLYRDTHVWLSWWCEETIVSAVACGGRGDDDGSSRLV
jgi:hypothetical protein